MLRAVSRTQPHLGRVRASGRWKARWLDARSTGGRRCRLADAGIDGALAALRAGITAWTKPRRMRGHEGERAGPELRESGRGGDLAATSLLSPRQPA